MGNPNYSATTTGFLVLDPTNPDGTPIFQCDSTGIYSNGVLVAVESANAAVTAHAGGGQSSATLLTAQYNLVTTVASNFDSVKLPVAVADLLVIIKNIGASILSVFPNTGASINAMAANLSIDIPIGGEVRFTAVSTTLWETNTALDLPAPSTQKGNLVIKASDSAGNTQTIITNASQAGARTYTIPDGGQSASSFLLTDNATTQTINTGSLAVAAGGVTTGSSGSAGTLTVFPAGSTTGKTTITASNNSGDTTTNINTAAQAGARTYTVPDAGGSDTFTMNAATQTLTNKTLTNFINTSTVRSSTQLDKTSDTAFASIVGLSVALVAGGTYKVKAHLPVTSGASGGVKVCLDTTDTLSLTSSNITGFIYNTAVSPVVVTTTSGLTTALSATQIAISVIIEATLVVNAAGTLVVKGAQNVSNGTTTSFYVGGYMEVTRIA